jgi:uracil-DNA glycosylase family 4
MNEVVTIGALNRELAQRVAGANLRFDCGADGVFYADTAVIGDSPGEREVLKKMPFVGGSGELLWNALRKHDIGRRQVYSTYAVKRRVITDKEENDKISPHERDHWEGMLQWELSQLPNLKYVILLGNYALSALVGVDGITNWRGSVLDVRLNCGRVVKAICCINPGMVLKEPKWEMIFHFDINKYAMVRSGKYEPYLIKAHINPTFKEAMDWISRMASSADKGLPISGDIEVINMETACLGLSDDNHEGMCINFRDLDRNRFSVHEEVDIRLAIQELFNKPNVKMVAQNGAFDAYFQWCKDRIRWPCVYIDTLLAHHTLYPSLPHNLGFLTAQYTTHPYYKDEGKDWKEGGNINQFWEYNVKDICITRAVSMKVHEELRSQGMESFFFNHVMRLQPHLVHMTVHGVKMDTPLKDHIATQLMQDVDKLRQDFWDAVHVATGDPDYNPNPKSWKQLQELLFNRLHLVGRGTSTNEENRKRMRQHPRTNKASQRVLDCIDKFAEEEKFRSTYAEMSIDDDGRVRCEYKQYGVAKAPGRLSSSQTMWGSGMNLQNQTSRSQTMFVADEGYEFLYFDTAQIEARIVGWLAPIPKWKEQFERARLNPGSYDAHCALASDMFGIPYDQVPTYDFEEDGTKTVRFTAKRCRHGLNYRMMPDRLATTAGMTLEEAERNWHLYHRTNPEIQEWWQETIERVKKDKCLYTPLGRRWMLMERFSDDALESIIAFVPQATAGDHVASVIYKAHDDPEWPRYRDGRLAARVVLNIHDALISLVRPSDRATCAAILKKHVEQPIIIRGEPLIIPADFKVSEPVGWRVETNEEGKEVIIWDKSEDAPHRHHRWSSLVKLKKVA